MKVTDLIRSYADLLPEPAGHYAEIVRLNSPDYRPRSKVSISPRRLLILRPPRSFRPMTPYASLAATISKLPPMSGSAEKW